MQALVQIRHTYSRKASELPVSGFTSVVQLPSTTTQLSEGTRRASATSGTPHVQSTQTRCSEEGARCQGRSRISSAISRH